ncbi:hypothetical protein OPW41_00910 [Vibrio europaeus]|uniref:Lipopolysaccharide biosynthesis protein n=1 Tax=Vibrio europaeus TaxID=300876 RepID=A0A178JB83_9VIBR|nr:hypothetical protein [Vibrio europaeus]MDC5703126.1 hypothetical protein [Vibrio europaeus]MDC5708642.1 hypothetical protein [Vibrio europaeus]MDC5713018.1 hypothetical protein [Vibrio europaeus]MDC5718031.1 hypothetical protein [Vibrio europaeus]MDC5725438.1 hypothetical protein [Vibrio europaeus]
MKVLFICPNWAGLADPIVREIVKQGHEVVHLDHSDFSKFGYFDACHRVLAKIYQLVTKNSYKHRTTDAEIARTINSFFIARPKFDVIIMTEPSLFKREHLDLLKQHCNKLVATLWDSLTKSPENKQHLDLFDVVFSYDHEDCNAYDLIKINNYLDPSWTTSVSLESAKYDVFSIMSYTKERYQQVVKFLDANPSISPNIYFYIDHPRKRKSITDKRIKVTDKLMLGDELKSNIESSKAILDFLQGHQAGLSFRVYECLGYQRKLISTNQNLKHYDIFCAENMVVLDSSYQVPEPFFSTPYFEPEPQIVDKYMLSSWVRNVLSKV